VEDQTTNLIASVQAAPVFMDLSASIEKACRLMEEAAHGGARLVVFPESFLPGYPDWVWAIEPGNGSQHQELYADLLDNAVEAPGEAVSRLGQAARDLGLMVVMGVTERSQEGSRSSLYNSQVFLGSDGQIMGVHRKLVPTGGERLVWTPGDGSTLAVYSTPLGRLSGLICWENYMPLARYALYAWGAQIYAASTWDYGEVWLSTMRHIAKEGGLYVISSCMVLRTLDIPDRYPFKNRYITEGVDWINPGDSVIVAPGGEILAGPLHEAEGILYAPLDLRRTGMSKWLLDTAGHYARPDVFRFEVDQKPRRFI